MSHCQQPLNLDNYFNLSPLHSSLPLHSLSARTVSPPRTRNPRTVSTTTPPLIQRRSPPPYPPSLVRPPSNTSSMTRRVTNSPMGAQDSRQGAWLARERPKRPARTSRKSPNGSSTVASSLRSRRIGRRTFPERRQDRGITATRVTLPRREATRRNRSARGPRHPRFPQSQISLSRRAQKRSSGECRLPV